MNISHEIASILFLALAFIANELMELKVKYKEAKENAFYFRLMSERRIYFDTTPYKAIFQVPWDRYESMGIEHCLYGPMKDISFDLMRKMVKSGSLKLFVRKDTLPDGRHPLSRLGQECAIFVVYCNTVPVINNIDTEIHEEVTHSLSFLEEQF